MMRSSDLNLLRFHKAGPLVFDAVKELLGVPFLGQSCLQRLFLGQRRIAHRLRSSHGLL
jgi:hypothetical protein